MQTSHLFVAVTAASLLVLSYARLEIFSGQHVTVLLFLSMGMASAVTLIYRLFIYPTFFDPLRHLPGPKGGLPLLGHALEQARRPPSLKYGEWIRDIPNEGLLSLKSVAGRNVLLPTSAQALSQVLVTKSYDFTKDEAVRRVLAYVLGDESLVTGEHDIHRVHRKNMQPMFGHRQIRNLHPLIWTKVVSMMRHITNESAGNDGNIDEVEVYQWASRATLDIIGIVALGHEFDSLENSDDKLSNLYTWFFTPRMGRNIFFAMNQMLPQLIIKFLPWRIEDEIKAKSKELHRECEVLVVQKKNYMEKHEKERVDVLEHMIDAGFFSNKELVDELLAMLAAGHETTSSSLTWTLYALATRRELQAKLRAEVVEAIDAVAGQQSLDMADFANVLDGLPLLHGVCNESQRMWPPVSITGRTAHQDTSIIGQPVPKGTKVVIPIWNINRLEKFWGTDAKDFKPERWINTDNGKPNNHGGCQGNFGFMTFLHGPRNCIGSGLARAELKALVAAWLYCFEFELADPTYEAVAAGIVTVKPKDGLKLKMKVLRSL